MINRELYINKLLKYKDTEFIKVITGIRRCGKSTVLKIFMEKLENENKDNTIIYMNFESFEFENITDYKKMYNKIKEKIKGRSYILLDEVQNVPEWEKCVRALLVDFDCDIYITGSNAYLLSSELSTYLAGRYVEIKMLPLSFKEFLDFYEFKNEITNDEKFARYMRYGGMPGVIKIEDEKDIFEDGIKGIYDSVFMKDIIQRNKILDANLLERVLKFIMKEVGNPISSKKITNFFISQGIKVSGNTILNYLEYLKNAYIIYKAPRYDIKGKTLLKTLEKYYIVDTGIRNVIVGHRDYDSGHSIENVIYFELLRRGYDVAVGKIDNLEVDFVATTPNDKKYIQVTTSLLDENVRKREINSLMSIKDHYEKIILTLDKFSDYSYEGIKCINLIDFLLEK